MVTAKAINQQFPLPAEMELGIALIALSGDAFLRRWTAECQTSRLPHLSPDPQANRGKQKRRPLLEHMVDLCPCTLVPGHPRFAGTQQTRPVVGI